jgi:hypothetical protein
MSKYDQNYQIRRREQVDTARTDEWVSQQGLTSEAFQSMDICLLRAQREARTLLSKHSELLTQSQCEQLEDFSRKMAKPRTRSWLLVDDN